MDIHPTGAAVRTIRTLFTAGTVGGLTDGELLERFSASDGEDAESAFAGLVERHGPMVLRVCRGVLHDAHEAEDAFQATFLILALKAGSIRGRDSLGSWLYSVAYNVAASARSAASRRRSYEQRAAGERPTVQSEGTPDDLGPLIHEELDRLPDRYRAVLVLCGLEGLTQHQAAERLGWPLGTVQSRLARGRERLRARLLRRGVAPSAAVLAWSTSSGVSLAAMPAALVDATVRLALTIGAARSLAIGTVPGSVIRLANQATKALLVKQAIRTGIAALLVAVVVATGAAVRALQAAAPTPAAAPTRIAAEPEQPPDASPQDGLLTVTGVVRMRDRSPVAGAIVRSITGSDEAPVVARTDATGRFRLQAVFGNGCTLRASSADGNYQAIVRVSSPATRDLPARPLNLTLLPALTQRVTIRSEGRPVAGARVAATGLHFQVEGLTGADGKVRLRLPAKEPLGELAAWHPTLGVAGMRDLDERPREAEYALSLLPPARQTIRLVDAGGHPVAGLELGASFRTEDSDWIVTSDLAEPRVRTDRDGKASLPWAPREKLQYVDVRLHNNPDWKIDEIDVKKIPAGLVTVHVRREVTVQGRLIMPAGADAAGILVSGFGFGPAGRGDIPFIRSLRDGTFRLRVPSEHAYVLGIDDLRWASDPWTGQILAKDSAQPAEIAIKVYPATPLTIRVTRGPSHEPVADAWVHLSSRGQVEWTNASGKKQSGTSGVGRWLRTDADGVARAGVGRGEQVVRLAAGNWNEEKTVNVTSEKPVEVAFHRAWTGAKRVTGRLSRDGAPYAPSPALAARAWATRDPLLRLPTTLFEPVVHPDGTFEVAFDADSAVLLFVDPDRERGGYVERVRGDAAVDVPMARTATYGGILLDENGRAMAGRTLKFYVQRGDYRPIASQQTDQAGRFRFIGLPSGVPLQIGLPDQGREWEYDIPDDDRLFNPGELRDDDRVKARRNVRASSNERPPVPLATAVEELCRNARPTGMRALVALLGDDSAQTVRTIDQLFRDEDQGERDILRYLTLRVNHAQLGREAAIIAGYGWPKPEPGEVVLVALDGDRKVISTRRIATKSLNDAVGAGRDFLKQHAPPSRNAQALLTEARDEARRSGRRVWVIHGGPRCGPCFRLARWIEDHHATLDRDYVIVRLMDGIDEHVAEAIAGLPIQDGDGIPWFAITEPDGTILAISRGPLGNIGFPTSPEDIRHFRGMLDRTARKLTAAEVGHLVESLAPDR